MDRVAVLARAAAEHWDLTNRQAEVLELVARGMSNRSIGETLGCSMSTVEAHVTALLKRAGATSRTGLLSKLLLIDP